MVLIRAAGIGRYGTRALGTRVEILTAEADAIAEAAVLLDAGAEWLDRLASRFRPDSELSRLNAAAGQRVAISADLREALEVALRAAFLSGGLVTPTVGGALRAIGYDRDFATMEPDQAGPMPPSGRVPAWEAIRLDPASDQVVVPPGVQIDLGATAKAWGADRIAEDARRALGCGVLVSLGGDVAMAGTPPRQGWTVGICDTSEGDPEAAQARVSVRDGGLASSGVVARSWRRGGRPAHHLIDPATGLPAESCWRTVSVCAGTCVDANTASTASVLRGAEAPEWLDSVGLPARLVHRSGRVVLTRGWPA